MTEDQRRVARQRLDKQLRRLDSRKFSFNRFSMRKRMAYALLAFIYIGALLMPTRGSSLPTGRLVKLTDDLESFRGLIDCKTIEHLSTGWAPGVVLDAFMDEEGMLARKPYFVFQGTKLFGNVLLLRRGKNSDSDSLTFNDFMAITELCYSFDMTGEWGIR